MKRSLLVGTALMLALAGSFACKMGLGHPSRDSVLPLLQKEADGLKQDGEKAILQGVKSTWTVQAVDVQEQPSDDAHPWRGTIRFQINTQMHDADGAITNDKTEKSFDYVYDAQGKRWLIQYTAPPPAKPRR